MNTIFYEDKRDIPIGVMLFYYGVTPPNSDWLVMNGTSFNASLYPDLFVLLGGNTLPDTRG